MADDIPTCPFDKYCALAAQGIISESEKQAKIDALRVNVINNDLNGKYFFEVTTVNDGDGNTTKGRGNICFTWNDKGEYVVSAFAYYGSGTNYNPSTASTWNGTLQTDKQLNFSEVLKSHCGAFVYYLNPTEDGAQLTGTYFWDIKRRATGTVTIELYAN
jgi:hypothetical protein